MPQARKSFLQRWTQRIFPAMPDFHTLLNQQCDLVVAGTAALVAYMQDNSDDLAQNLFEIERQSTALAASNMTILHQAFATPWDREDIYRSIAALNEIMNYSKTTVREMQGLQLGPDEHTRAMADLLHQGACSLQQGYLRLSQQPLLAEADADAARETERTTENIYRNALSELFDASHYVATLTPEQQKTAESLDVLMQELNVRETAAVGSAVGFVLEILKRREVYRHMSNAADQVAHAGNVLHDIVAKVA